jgi:cytochrome c-type biogenesis protein CcmH/NrfF
VLGALLLSALLVPASAPATGTVQPRASLPVIERQVMCVTCKIPLMVAESPEADRERAFIQKRIDEGRSEAQIKRDLVAEYGPAVLGLPAAKGFDLTVYLVPIAVVLLIAGLLAFLLPSWRRRARDRESASQAQGPSLSPAQSALLDEDLARYDP